MDVQLVTPNELHAVVNTIDASKAVGPDGLAGCVIREIYRCDEEWFLLLFNRCLHMGLFPHLWKTSRVRYILKENKDKKLVNSYRPICILNIWGKILDKILADRLYYYLESKGVLSERQYGFRKGRSTIDAIYDAVKIIQDIIQRKELVGMISLDMSNAFGSIRRKDIIEILIKIDVPVYLRNIITNFLFDRKLLRSTLNKNMTII